MKPLLAGAAAAATVVLAALAGWALFGPRSPPRAGTPPATAAPAAARIAQHAQAVARAGEGMRYVGMEESLARPREGYRVTFAADDGANNAAARAKDDAASAARQADWQRRFCTAALQGEMAARGVNVVTGRVVGADGRTAYAADCVRGQPAQQAGPGGPML